MSLALTIVILFSFGVACGAEKTAIPQDLLLRGNRLFLDHFDQIEKSGGRDLAADIASRMSSDWGALGTTSPPVNYTQAGWQERNAHAIDLDTELIDALLAGKQDPLDAAPGLRERVRKAADGTLQPYALYVPASALTSKRRSVVMLLHGAGEVESELLSSPIFRDLADRTATIVVVPWGRGDYAFAGAATADVYGALDEVQAVFPVDSSRTFLAGYSMGGFSTFTLGVLQPNRWAGVLCISGALADSVQSSVRSLMAAKPFFIVHGQQDSVVPFRLGEKTVADLRLMHADVKFYPEPKGEHWLYTLKPSLRAAWLDMLGLP